MNEILDRIKSRKILVVGDVILDRYIWGRVERINPEAPVPVVEVTDDTFMLGGAANVAANIASMGAKASVCGITGHDRAAEVLGGMLEDKGIGSLLIPTDRPTTVKTRVIAHSQQVVRFDREKTGPIEGKALRAVREKLLEAIKTHDAVIISDYKKGVVTAQLIEAAVKAAGKKFIALDPKVGHFHLYKNVSIMTPNLSEASKGSGIEIKDAKSLKRAGETLMRKHRLQALLITMGDKGMCLFERGKMTEIPTAARKVFDVTGAGDTVIAALTLARAAGATLEESAIIANKAAGIVVAQVGTATATIKELKRALR